MGKTTVDAGYPIIDEEDQAEEERKKGPEEQDHHHPQDVRLQAELYQAIPQKANPQGQSGTARGASQECKSLGRRGESKGPCETKDDYG